jgi:hypothetical protein
MKYKNFEDYMMYKHAEQHIGTKDTLIDDFPNWFYDLDMEDIFKYADYYASDYCVNKLQEIKGE